MQPAMQCIVARGYRNDDVGPAHWSRADATDAVLNLPSNRKHVAFLGSVALFWLGSEISAERVDPGQNRAIEARNAKCFLLGT